MVILLVALVSCFYFLRIFVNMKPSEINAKWNQLQQRIAEDFDTDLPDMKVSRNWARGLKSLPSAKKKS
jgi:hypothetical protein